MIFLMNARLFITSRLRLYFAVPFPSGAVLDFDRNFVTTSLTPPLSPRRGSCQCPSADCRIIVRPIPSLVFSQRRRTILLLLGEKAGMRADVKQICRTCGWCCAYSLAPLIKDTSPVSASSRQWFSSARIFYRSGSRCSTQNGTASSARPGFAGWHGQQFVWPCPRCDGGWR